MNILNSFQLFDNAPDAMIIIDQAGCMVHANIQTVTLFGYSIDELTGKTIEYLLPNRLKDRHVKHRIHFQENPSIRRMGSASMDLYLQCKSGDELPCDISLSPLKTAEGEFVIASIRDISELHSLRVRVENICDNAPVGLCYFDINLKFVHVNQWLASMNGLTINEHIGYSIGELIPDIAGTIEPQLRQVIESKIPVTDEVVQGSTPAYPDKKRSFMHSYYPDIFDDGTVMGVRCVVKDITELRQLEAENAFLLEEIQLNHSHHEILGTSLPIRKLLKLIEQVAPTESIVLIEGETGTGKELVAQEIHRLSSRSDKMMVIVNCAALPATLIESELFGREKGAFTGALSKQIGRFEAANNSTIFLDEIGELPLELQAKLLRVLQEGEIERLGGSQTIKVNARVIVATNLNLQQLTNENKFRSDLYYRLSTFPITTPPLRERKEDIPELVRSFVGEYNSNMAKHIDNIPKTVMQQLFDYPWLGNVRELRNVIERAMILSPKNTLEVQLNTLNSSAFGQPSKKMEDVERAHILSVLDVTHWRIRGDHGAAVILGLKPSTLDSRMIKLGIKRDE